jgi:hypothetical protein
MKLQPVQKMQRPLGNPMSEQRGGDRIPLSFGLMYSGLDENEVLMGDGTVIDMSGGGLGIRGNQLVKVGMDLTLFLYLPDKEDPLFTVQAQVAWVHGHRFGVQLQHMTAREEHRLQRFLQSLSRTSGKA